MKRLFAVTLLAATLATLATLTAAPGLGRGASSIQGTVTDAKHHEPLMSVFVAAFAAHARTPLAMTRTGKDGTFRIGGLAAGEYRLLLSKTGFQSVEVSGLTVATADHLIVGFPIALETARPGNPDPIELLARCNTLVNPGEVADVYVICGGR